MKILLVDHSPSIRRVELHILELMGYTDIEQASDAAEAIEKLQSGNFGFVITDWNLPHLGGLELLKRIRSDDSLKKIPVLMVVNKMNDKIILLAAKAGVSSLIVKPFTLHSLKEKINNIFP